MGFDMTENFWSGRGKETLKQTNKTPKATPHTDSATQWQNQEKLAGSPETNQTQQTMACRGFHLVAAFRKSGGISESGIRVMLWIEG